MVSYTNLPQEIKESYDIRSIRKKSPFWEKRKLLSVYMEAYVKGVKSCEKDGLYPTDEARDFQMIEIATYYVLRKEFFKRMSPLVAKRNPDMILLDNKKLMDRFDACMMEGVDENSGEAEMYIREICNRMD